MSTFYSYCPTIQLDCILYSDPTLNDPLPAGFHADGVNCYETDFNGKVSAISTCTIPCDMAMGELTSTDPTTIGGTDGTITVQFTTSNGPSTYTLNGVAQGAAVSPLVIHGLSSSVPYTILITDTQGCSALSNAVTLGQSATVFDSDWMQITYEFSSPGRDLDTKSRIVSPNIGQTNRSMSLGFCSYGGFDTINPPLTSYTQGGSADVDKYLILFGGDNTGVGFESVLINLKRFKLLFPGITEVVADLRGFWHSTGAPTTNPVKLSVVMWKDLSPVVGKPVHDGCVQGSPWCWTYPTSLSHTIDSVSTSVTIQNSCATDANRIATMKYNFNTFVAILDSNDTTTPIPPP